MTARQFWWRGESPAKAPRGHVDASDVVTGRCSELTIPPVDDRTGLRDLYFFDAQVSGADLAMDDIHLSVEWSQFEDCHFAQRVRPVLNQQGIAAQGSFANRPAVYRNCMFERVRFKILGGFSMGRALFDGCTFLNCRWEGHFAHDAWLVDNRFLGRMNGCVWFGVGGGPGLDGGPNVIRGNDFTETQFTTSVGWRCDFPVTEQLWPEGYSPSVDD